MLYDIPAVVHTLAQGSRAVGTGGTNDFGKVGYGGPCPPPGSPHRYYFRLYALDVESLGIRAGAARAELAVSIEGHVLGQAEYMGRFQA